MQRIIIGTAGHVDHGKSLLAKTLTGVDPDRLPEEKKREMTIDLGFVFFPINEQEEVAIIDVPGHERFLKTMIAGANSIRMVLFVVAADEGIMPQTVEHLDVLKLMHIEKGMIVITKIDRIAKEYVAVVEQDIGKLVKGSFLENAPIFAVSSLTKQGIDEYKNALRDFCKDIKPLPDDGIFRCPIDRIFTMKGFGTVVAGTVLSGRIKKSDTIELLPEAKKTRIRNLQVHNEPVKEVIAGQRAAFNLMDLTTRDVFRGCELSIPDYLEPTQVIDGRVSLLAKAQKPLKNNDVVRFHKGACEVISRVITLDKEKIEPGDEGFVQFRLEKPVVGVRNERFLIRSYTPIKVIGGGNLLEIYAKKKGCRFRKERIDYLNKLQTVENEDVVEIVMYYAFYPIAGEKELVKLTNLPINIVSAQVQRLLEKDVILRLKDKSIVHHKLLEELKKKCLISVEKYTNANPLEVLMGKGELARVLKISHSRLLERTLEELREEGKIELNARGIKIVGFEIKISSKAQRMSDAIENFALERGFKPFKFNDIIYGLSKQDPGQVRDLLNYLLKNDMIIEILKGIYLHKKMLEQAKSKLIQHIKREGSIRAIECRNLLGVSREATKQILDYSFNHGITIRTKGTHRLPEAKEQG